MENQNNEAPFEYYDIKEIKEMLKRKEHLVYVDDGIEIDENTMETAKNQLEKNKNAKER